MRRSIIFTTLFVLLFSAYNAFAADIWVSTKGNDNNDGSRGNPKLTIQSAIRQAREMRRLNAPGIERGINIIIEGGTYDLYEPLYVRPEDSGTKHSPTVFKSAKGEKVTLSGGIDVINWKKSGNMWVADAPDFNGRPVEFRQMWVNGQKAVRARDVDDFEKMYRIVGNDPQSQILWVPSKAVKSILNAPYAEMVLHEMWCIANLRIKSIDVQGDSAAVRFHNPESKIQFEHPWPSPMTTPGRESAFYLTNAKELLDKPGEWFHDIKTGKIYYYPLAGEVINKTKVTIPVVETLLKVEGTLDRRVENVIFRDIDFNYTTWMRPSHKGHVPLQAGMYLREAYRLNPQMERPDNNHKLDNQDWLGRPAAAVLLSGTSNVNFEGCSFEHIASTALDYEWGNQGGTVKGCLFRDVGGNGLVVGSFSPAAHETHLPYNPTDQRELCSGQTISNNLFVDITNEDWGCVAICAGYVDNINIEHNEIREVSYTGISLGWGWNRTVVSMKNNRVFANNISRYAKHMYDVAGVYTLGAQPGSVISENYVHDIYTPSYVHDPEHWFYLYTDEGSSYIEVKDNWCAAEKFLQNANGPGNLWENNGPMVDEEIKNRAGLQSQFKYLLEK